MLSPHSLPVLGLFLAFFTIAPANAMDSTEPLPARINSPAFRFGSISGVDSKYNSSGGVVALSDINTIEFNSDQLKKVMSKEGDTIKTLILVLNQNSGTDRFGDQLNLGTLRIDTVPDVKYFVPIYARGITDNLSLAVAMPVVFYKNKLSLVQSNSNANEICDQIGANPALQEACTKLRATKMTEEVRAKLATLGYRPIQDRKETLMGDLQLVSFWRFFNRDKHSIVLRNTLILPTGKPNDPDDLADLGSFGETATEALVLYNYLPWKSLRLSTKAVYKLTLPDHVDARVPKDNDDFLPGSETRQRVGRNLGDTITLGTAATWNFYGDFGIAGGYEYARKSSDRYSGSAGGRYDLLERDSSSEAHRLRGGISYDTIGLYQRKKNFPPMKFDFEVTNTVAGRNTDRSLTNELSVTLFF